MHSQLKSKHQEHIDKTKLILLLFYLSPFLSFYANPVTVITIAYYKIQYYSTDKMIIW